MYIYRFLDESNDVIYVGRTNNLIRRIRQHFGTSGHLPPICYQKTKLVEYAQVTSENDAKMYELYYIEQHHPMYNTADIGGGSFSIALPELSWEIFDFQMTKSSLTKDDIIRHITGHMQELDNECNFIDNLLRDKDQLSWLSKLNDDERNEYLRIIYTLERLVQNLKTHNQTLKDTLLNQ